MDTRERSLERFTERSQQAAIPWHREVAAPVDRFGGLPSIADMHDGLTEVQRRRPSA